MDRYADRSCGGRVLLLVGTAHTQFSSSSRGRKGHSVGIEWNIIFTWAAWREDV